MRSLGVPALGVALVLAGCALAPPPLVEIPKAVPEPPVVRPAPQLPEEQALPAPLPEGNRVFRMVAGQPRYLLGPGDGVELTLLGEPEPKPLGLTLDEAGELAVPYAGRIPVTGLTLAEAESCVSQRLSSVLQNPKASLRLVAPAAHRVFLRAGSLSKVVALGGRTTLAELLAAQYQGSDEGRVHLRRGGNVWTVGLASVFLDSSPAAIVLDDGDVVAVDAAKPSRFFVIGEVARQGAYPLEGATDALQAIAAAGGFTAGAHRQAAAVLRGDRTGSGGPQLIAAALGPGGPLLADGDVVYVGRSGFGDWNAFLEQLRPSLDFLGISSSTANSLQNLTR